MDKFVKLFNVSYLLWFAMAVPWIIVVRGYLNETIYYGEFIHKTGQYSVWLLILTMAISPLRMFFSNAAWLKWLMRQRRYFGVASFAYAIPHLVAYLVKLGSFARVIEDGIEPGMWTGWIAFFLFALLAITSNNFSVGKLKKNWKALHNLIYAATALMFLHWVMLAFDPTQGAIVATMVIALESIRLLKPSHK